MYRVFNDTKIRLRDTFCSYILQNREKSLFLIMLRLLLFQSILMRNTGTLLKLGYSRVISGMIPSVFVVLV